MITTSVIEFSTEKMHSQVQNVSIYQLYLLLEVAIFYCLLYLRDVCCVANARGGRVCFYTSQTRNVLDRKLPRLSRGNLSITVFSLKSGQYSPVSNNRNYVSRKKVPIARFACCYGYRCVHDSSAREYN